MAVEGQQRPIAPCSVDHLLLVITGGRAGQGLLNELPLLPPVRQPSHAPAFATSPLDLDRTALSNSTAERLKLFKSYR
jgi:hypothetical protein